MDDDFTEDVASVDQAQCILARLTPRQREAVMWRMMGYTVREVAGEMGIDRKRVYRLLKRAGRGVQVSESLT